MLATCLFVWALIPVTMYLLRPRPDLTLFAEESGEPIHEWFGLSYSSYLVLPRSVLQSAPVETQRRLVSVLDDLHAHFGYIPPDSYSVQARDEKGRFIRRDPLANYWRGRARVDRDEEGRLRIWAEGGYEYVG